MQSFRGAGGGGVVTYRTEPAAAHEYELGPLAQDVGAAGEADLEGVLAGASIVLLGFVAAAVGAWLIIA